MPSASDNKKANFTITDFKRVSREMVLTSNNAYSHWINESLQRNYDAPLRNYTDEEISSIIETGSSLAQATLSRAYFSKNGFYKRIIAYFSTLLKYSGMLIPNPAYGKSLQTEHVARRYHQAVDFLDKIKIPTLATSIFASVFIDGCYYGVITNLDKKSFSALDLPHNWCRSVSKDETGADLVQFNVTYFDTIIDKEARNSALVVYPDYIATYYEAWLGNKGISPWFTLPAEDTLYFEIFNDRPFFLNTIPSTLAYDEAVKREAIREAEEIKKIIVQKIPHLNDGSLLFEPDEALEMHKGSVGMLKKSNPNTSILTTYADVDAIISKTSSDGTGANNGIERMKNNVYNEAGVSPQIFAATGNLAIEASFKNDLALVMVIGNKFSLFITNIINRVFSNANIDFKYTLLPISWANEKDFINNSYKMVNTGYSLLLPALAMGYTQKDFVNIKNLENDLLGLNSKLIPPAAATTRSANEEGAGRRELPIEEKSDKTIKNEAAKENGGGN